VVGIRPFCIDIFPERSDRHTIPAEVFVVEPMGASTVISLNAGNTRMQIVYETGVSARSGDVMWLALDPARILLFDAETGKRL
jgi:multiple sugar transport system ATP-binding protein